MTKQFRLYAGLSSGPLNPTNSESRRLNESDNTRDPGFEQYHVKK